MNKNEELLKRREGAVCGGVGRLNTVTARQASGAEIIDENGKTYIDLASGIGVLNVGHCHPKVVAAIQEQAQRLTHTCIHVATYEPYVALCEKLAGVFPHGEKTRVMLVNSGAEAVENAVKIARQATGKSAILCFTEGFHGRTLLSTTLTSKVGYKLGCGPYAPEIYRIQYPNYFRYGDGLSQELFVQRELNRFRETLHNRISSDQVAAVILECIQGEGGFNVAPFDYLRGLRQLCDEHGILLILDEVQSGFCRTGKWAAYEHAGVLPDLSTWAKAMGGGMPISCVIGKADVMDRVRPGTIGGTYGGNPIACAASLAAIEVMEQEDLNARAEAVGQTLRARLEELKSRCPALIDVRGLGAMIAMEFSTPDCQPAKALCTEVIQACIERGVLVIAAGTYGNIIRLLPPLVITEEQLDRALTVLTEEIERHALAVAS